MVDKLVTTMSGRTTYDFGREETEVLTETETLTADDCGKLFFLSAVAGFTITLPSLADAGAGWSCQFIVKTAPTSNGYIITEKTTTETNKVVVNGIAELEVDTSDDGVYNAGCTTMTFAANLAVPGDRIQITTDGTYWYARGQTNADGGVAAA